MRARIATRREGAVYVPAYSVNNVSGNVRRYQVMNNHVKSFRAVVREWLQA